MLTIREKTKKRDPPPRGRTKRTKTTTVCPLEGRQRERKRRRSALWGSEPYLPIWLGGACRSTPYRVCSNWSFSVASATAVVRLSPQRQSSVSLVICRLSDSRLSSFSFGNLFYFFINGLNKNFFSTERGVFFFVWSRSVAERRNKKKTQRDGELVFFIVRSVAEKPFSKKMK